MTENNQSNVAVDKHFNIHKQVIGSNYVHACLGKNHPHTNITYFSQDGEKHHVEIPHLEAELSDTKSGLVVSCKN
tara:strand:- start:1864 stop:2088 length:225 start_codon:yes stop_codon:yes gene_type:complete